MEPVKVSKSPYTNVVRYASGYDHPDFSCIFVHAGAGYHSTENEQKHLRSCRNACLAAMALLRNGSSAVDAVEAAIRVMEDDPVTNCGFGSNLNFDGRVEADASIMDCFGRTGAIGAVPQVTNPIALSRLILERSSVPMTLKRVPPNFVVGDGAVDYAREHGFPVVNNDQLVAHPARVRFVKWQKEIEYKELMKKKAQRAANKPKSIPLPVLQASSRPIFESGSALPDTPTPMPSTPQLMQQEVDVITDTVGAICIDRYGNMAAGSSSGGIGMKQPGRVGPAALIGVGTYVRDVAEVQVGTVVSGTGEHMLPTLISSTACNRLWESTDEMETMKSIILDDFMAPQGVGRTGIWGEPAIGVMSVKAENVSNGKRLISFIFGHNTDSFALASMSSNEAAPKTIMSRTTIEPKLAIGGSVRTVPMTLQQITKYTNPNDQQVKALRKGKDKTKRKQEKSRKGDAAASVEDVSVDGSDPDDDCNDENDEDAGFPVMDRSFMDAIDASSDVNENEMLINLDGKRE